MKQYLTITARFKITCQNTKAVIEISKKFLVVRKLTPNMICSWYFLYIQFRLSAHKFKI
jgi:hypothetical protein